MHSCQAAFVRLQESDLRRQSGPRQEHIPATEPTGFAVATDRAWCTLIAMASTRFLLTNTLGQILLVGGFYPEGTVETMRDAQCPPQQMHNRIRQDATYVNVTPFPMSVHLALVDTQQLPWVIGALPNGSNHRATQQFARAGGSSWTRPLGLERRAHKRLNGSLSIPAA